MYWRHSAAGHLEAFDTASFSAALQMRKHKVSPEDFETLEAMWNTQRHRINEQVNARIEAANKG